MNLPNKLTVFRVILIVPFVVALLGGERRLVRRQSAAFGNHGAGDFHHRQSDGPDRRQDCQKV